LLNGTKVYYEVYGHGAPLFFLHGFTHSSKSWFPYLNDYVDDFEVYLVDLKGHGKSSPFTETLSIQSAARDVEGLIKYLQLVTVLCFECRHFAKPQTVSRRAAHLDSASTQTRLTAACRCPDRGRGVHDHRVLAFHTLMCHQ